MGFIQADTVHIDPFKKAVFSFWFRVPQESIDAAKAAYVGQSVVPGGAFSNFSAPVPFDGIIPLVTFGDAPASYMFWWSPPNNAAYTRNLLLMGAGGGVYCSTTNTLTESTGVPYSYHIEGDAYVASPSYIGLDCTSNDGGPYLAINLQMSDFATASEVVIETTGVSVDPVMNELSGFSYVFDADGNLCPMVTTKFSPSSGSNQYVFNDPFHVSYLLSDNTSLWLNSQPEVFRGVLSAVDITPDRWHHVVVSIDLSGSISAQGNFNGSGQSISSDCKIWIALDDVNYSGSDFSAHSDLLADPNAIITQRAIDTYYTNNGTATGFDGAAGEWHWEIDTYSGGASGSGTYSYSPTGLSVGSLGIPATDGFSDHIWRCEMAEFQLYTGVTMDTSVVENRRAFITDTGKPFGFIPIPIIEAPTAPAAAAAAILGKQPDILLHGSTYWIAGINFGTSNDKFNATGTVQAYAPSPDLAK